MADQFTYQLKIISTETKKDVIFYTIQVVNTSSKLSWQFVERYRNMGQLNQQIASYTKSLPQFPPKKIFGNTDPDFVSQRKAGLQNYFKTLLQHVDVDQIPPLKEFLTRGDSKSIRDPKNEVQASQQQQQQQQQPFQQNSKPNNQNQQQQHINKAKIIKSQYDKITNDTNTKFIDLGFNLNPPEENDTEKKRFLFDQVKVESKHTESYRNTIQRNSDSTLLMAYPLLEQTQPDFFQLLKKVQNEIDRIFEIN